MAKREENKSAKCLELMRRQQGATVQELIDATGWKKTSVAGFIQNAKKKHNVQHIEPKTYAIVDEQPAPADGAAA